jgi:transcriptional regulator with XRE-family HTH domain
VKTKLRRKSRAKRSPKRGRLKGPIHARIAALRKGLGLTQETLADIIGVGGSSVCHWEKGVARPDHGRLIDVASALGISVEELIEGEEAA